MLYKAFKNLIEEPVFIKIDDAVPENTAYIKTTTGKIFPAQATEGGIVAIITAEKNEEIDFSIVESFDKAVNISKNQSADLLEIKINNEIFTTYSYSDKFLKSFFGKFLTRDGTSFTRLDLSAKEHPHQRSVFFGIGDINGCDLWNEKGKNFGSQKHIDFSEIKSGNAFGKFTQNNIWCSSDSSPLLDEKRTAVFYNQNNSCRYVDIETVFTASYYDVEIGATKEAGPLGIRMDDEFRADTGKGCIRNSYGAVGEEECWGKSAVFCEYSTDKYKVSVFDNENNILYPTAWHIRNYGLFAANNLFFKGGYKLEKGESVAYKYRICFSDSNINMSERFVIYNLISSK